MASTGVTMSDGNRGCNPKNRVLYCSNICLSLDYEEIYLLSRKYGKVERIRLKLSSSGNSYDCYVVFDCSESASSALNGLDHHLVNTSVIRARLFNIDNFKTDEYDFIPKEDDYVQSSFPRKSPRLLWYVATYKEGRENFLRASECIERKIGNVPYENLKRYGRNILIKAGNDTQSMLLSNFKPTDHGNINHITPHKSFNTCKGLIFSEDLYDFSEEDILNMCPGNVCEVKKLRGNKAILLIFTTSFVPDELVIRHSRFRVKKYKQRPTQCYNCLEYGHSFTKCTNNSKCSQCSAEHEEGACSSNLFCLHCNGNHSPKSKECPRFKLEQDILEVANTEHISIGSAKRKIMGANRSPNSTYASVVKIMRQRPNSTQNPGSTERNKIPSKKQLNSDSAAHSVVLSGASDSASPVPGTIVAAEPISNSLDLDTLPDLADSSKVKKATPKEQRKSTNGPSVRPKPQKILPTSKSMGGKEKLKLETKSKIITIKNKQASCSADSEGFIEPPVKKRAKNKDDLKHADCDTSNSFNPLMETDNPTPTSIDVVSMSSNQDGDDIEISESAASSSQEKSANQLEIPKQLIENLPLGTHGRPKELHPSKLKRLQKNLIPQHPTSSKDGMSGKGKR